MRTQQYYFLVFFTVIFSCSSEKKNELDNWEPISTERIEHATWRGQNIQVIYSTANAGLLSSVDTSLKVEIYHDSLLLEEIDYDIYSGDTTKWSHHINQFNSTGDALSA